MAKIRYIGKKERKTTSLCNVVWYGAGDVQEVSDPAAVGRLLLHTDSYELADGETVPVIPTKQDVVVDDDVREDKMPNLDTMDREALVAYARAQFGHEFHHKTGEDKMRHTIVGLMNRG